ncbi:putative myb-like DNA-binding protein [Phytophthora cinnamomi]|uniref:putative myb-like DNA-binding protein n=1 Tax=Phytophthora cinnamomi TaxID=4785 RepID=UPI00355A53C6|nr:putative myb-like DNA-binding protein [Phytophthora cinnamomi]
MAISDQVRSQLFQSAPSPSRVGAKPQAIRIPTTRGGSTRGGLAPAAPTGRGLWTPEEHLRFLEALDKFPAGPWKCIAQYVGSKTARQAMTHGQKYRQKIARRRRGLKKIVRDLQFAAVDAHDSSSSSNDNDNGNGGVNCSAASARLSIDSNPMELSDQDFAAFVASLDLAQELQHGVMGNSRDSPLVVAAAAVNEELPSFSLGELDVDVPPASASSDCGLPTTTAQQDVHHWVVMDRADASSEEFSLALAEAFHAGSEEAYAFARPLPLPEQLLDEYCQEQMGLEPLVADPAALEGLDSLEFDGFALR